jgi:hypothetical protein
MAIISLPVSYPRPQGFSNPDDDFSFEELHSIIIKDDKDLTITDFICIFQAFIPAGTYEECAYFIPVLLQRAEMESKNEHGEAGELYSDLIEWLNFFHQEAMADGMLQSVKDILLLKLSTFLENYTIDYKTLEKHGYPIAIHISSVDALFFYMNERVYFGYGGDAVLENKLRQPLTYVSAAWFFTLFKLFLSEKDIHEKMSLSPEWWSETPSKLLERLSAEVDFQQEAREVIMREMDVRNDDRFRHYWDVLFERIDNRVDGKKHTNVE